MPKDSLYCPDCGEPLDPDTATCPECDLEEVCDELEESDDYPAFD